MNTNVNTAINSSSERVVENGFDENGSPFVITEKGTYPNIVRIKYEGNNIPDGFKKEITKEEQDTEVSTVHPERFLQNRAEDIQINASDTYQEVKPPVNVEDQSGNIDTSIALDAFIAKKE